MSQSVTMTLTVTTEDIGTLLRMWRAAADLSIEEVSARATELLGPRMPLGRETVRRYERGRFPAAGPNPTYLAAIAIACGRRISELPDEVRTDVELVSQLLRKPCFPLSALSAA